MSSVPETKVAKWARPQGENKSQAGWLAEIDLPDTIKVLRIIIAQLQLQTRAGIASICQSVGNSGNKSDRRLTRRQIGAAPLLAADCELYGIDFIICRQIICWIDDDDEVYEFIVRIAWGSSCASSKANKIGISR